MFPNLQWALFWLVHFPAFCAFITVIIWKYFLLDFPKATITPLKTHGLFPLLMNNLVSIGFSSLNHAIIYVDGMQMWEMLCYVDKLQVQKIVQNPSHIQVKVVKSTFYFLFFLHELKYWNTCLKNTKYSEVLLMFLRFIMFLTFFLMSVYCCIVYLTRLKHIFLKYIFTSLLYIFH